MDPLTIYDPMVHDAAERLFADLAPKALAATDGGDPDESLREAVDEAGFADALPALDARDAWPAAAALLRAQGRHAAPYDMADALIGAAVGNEPGDAASEAASEARRQRAFALARCLQIIGALDASLALSTRYVCDRKQFGRPLAAFQAIQHQLAIAAEKAAAAQAAVDLAVSAVCTEGINDDRSFALIDAAVIVAGDAVTCVYDAAHQVHGAIGFTREYALHHHSINLLRWRGDAAGALGGEIRCAERLGAAVIREGGLWRMVTDMTTLGPGA